MTDIPTFTARRETRNGTRLFIARCPVCGSELVHGDTGSDFTHRAAHCGCWRAGYYLEAITKGGESCLN